ncbi:MAG: hypothetical protein GKR98_01540 [Boseongicola sp.]|nr:MAG: hypothetical protein GKR98_01540 [Boseongicola sp.]
MPLPEEPRGCAFDRITRRRGVDLATTNMCCTISADGEVVLAFGAVTPKPLVLRDESRTLGDTSASPADRSNVIERMAANAAPITDVRANADYRTAMLKVMVARSLEVAQKRLSERMLDA